MDGELVNTRKRNGLATVFVALAAAVASIGIRTATEPGAANGNVAAPTTTTSAGRAENRALDLDADKEREPEKDRMADPEVEREHESGETAEEEEGRKPGVNPGGIEWMYQQRAFPNGIPTGALAAARGQANLLPPTDGFIGRPIDRPAPGSYPNWGPLGPRPLNYAAGTGASGLVYGGPGPYGGRTTSIATHPTNAAIAYLGSANGGVWKTTDSGVSWNPVFDSGGSMAVGSVAIDRSNPQTVYAGTGEANLAGGLGGSYYGTGVYKSNDGGVTWTKLAEPRFNSCHISALMVQPNDSNVVLAAASYTGSSPRPSGCDFGVYRSGDGGATWTKTSTVQSTQDFGVSVGAPTTVFMGAYGTGLYKSVNGGQTWTLVSGAGLPTTNFSRIEVDVSPSTPSVAVVAFTNASTGGLAGMYRTTDGGSSWTLLPAPTPDFCNFFGNGGQCWYDLALAINPTDPTQWMAGGQVLRKYTASGLSSAEVLNPFPVNGASGVHWDQHALSYDAAGRLWIGNDGGVYRSDDGGTTAANLNATVGNLQFYPGISGSLNGPLIGGFQDNGSGMYTGVDAWRQIGWADGGYTGIDKTTTPATMYLTWQNLGVLRSIDGGTTFQPGTSGQSGDSWTLGIPNSNVEARQFIAPFVLGGGSPRRAYAGTTRVYRSVNRAANWTAASPPFPSTVTAIAEGSANGSVLYAGTATGNVEVSVDSGVTWTDTNLAASPIPNRFVTDFAVDPVSSSHVFVGVSGFDNGATIGKIGHFFESSNGGTTWTNRSGTGAGALPDTPVNAIVYDNSTVPARLFVGTDVGVFASLDGGSNWARMGQQLPNTVILDLLLDPAAGSLIAATHGRGMFSIGLPDVIDPTVAVSAPVANAVVSKPVPISGTATDNVAVSSVALSIYRSVAGGQYWNGSAWQATFTRVSATVTGAGTSSATWSYSFVPPDAAGTFAVSAVAFDSSGRYGLSPYTIFSIPDTVDPTGSIAAPANNAAVAKPVVISGTASDNAAVAGVELTIYGNGKFWNGTSWQAAYVRVPAILGSAGALTSSWSYSFNPPDGAGYYAVSALIYDSSYRYIFTPYTSFNIPDLVDPTGSITAPIAGAAIAKPVTMSGTASDDNSVLGVELTIYGNGKFWNGSAWQVAYVRVPTTLASPGATSTTWSYSFDPPTGGYYAVSALVFDSSYRYIFTPYISFSVPDAVSPTGSITTPTEGATVTRPVAISGVANDNVGIYSIQVSIYSNGQWWNGSSFQAAFTRVPASLSGFPGDQSLLWSYTFAAPAAGSYIVLATITDIFGNYIATPNRSFSAT
jgi:Bacterial Ig domain